MPAMLSSRTTSPVTRIMAASGTPPGQLQTTECEIEILSLLHSRVNIISTSGLGHGTEATPCEPISGLRREMWVGPCCGDHGELSPLGPVAISGIRGDADSEVFHRRSKVPKTQGMNFLPPPYVVFRRYALFISHAWDYKGEYEGVVNLLNWDRGFLWENLSVPEENPLAVLLLLPRSYRYLVRQIDERVSKADCLLV